MRKKITICLLITASGTIGTETAVADTRSWKDAPIIGLAPSDGHSNGRIIVVPDTHGGIWRVDTETGMVSRCWSREEIGTKFEDFGGEIVLDDYTTSNPLAPLCSPWTEK